MTPFEIFIAYAKIRGIMPDLKKLENNNTKMYYDYDPSSGQYKKLYTNFRGIFNSHFKANGFGNTLFVSLLYQYTDGGTILRRDKVSYAHKRWLAFVRNNVKLDNGPKVGDTVKYKSWNQIYEGKISHICDDYSRIRVERGDNRIPQYISPGNIIEVNGKPLELSFHIKWKGKEYGKK